MTVGKTFQTISKADVFAKISEEQVLSAVFPDIKALPCLMHSPLRQDNHPSFSIYMTNGGHIAWKDHAINTPDGRGGLVDLLCQYWHCNFQQALMNITNLPVFKQSIALRQPLKVVPRGETNLYSNIEVKVREWRDYDLQYWESYGVSRKWLEYAEVYPISHKIITKTNPKTGESTTYTFGAEKYSYCYVERKEGKLQLKLYAPFSKKAKWCSKMDSSVISLWTKVPKTGDKIVICSSLKDALCLWSNTGIPAIAPQGEGYRISDTAANELRKRFTRVYICYDVDKPGIEDAKRLAEQTGFIDIIPDLQGEKDISDYYKSLKDKSQFQKLKELFK